MIALAVIGGCDESLDGKRKCRMKSKGSVSCGGTADIEFTHGHLTPGTDYTFTDGSAQPQDGSGTNVGSATAGTASNTAGWTKVDFPATALPAGAKQVKFTLTKQEVGVGGKQKTVCIVIKVT